MSGYNDRHTSWHPDISDHCVSLTTNRLTRGSAQMASNYWRSLLHPGAAGRYQAAPALMSPKLPHARTRGRTYTQTRTWAHVQTSPGQ